MSTSQTQLAVTTVIVPPPGPVAHAGPAPFPALALTDAERARAPSAVIDLKDGVPSLRPSDVAICVSWLLENRPPADPPDERRPDLLGQLLQALSDRGHVTLNLSACDLEEADLLRLANLLARDGMYITSLVLHQCGLEDADATGIANLIGFGSKLVELDLSDNELSDGETGRVIAQALESNTTLRSLNLARNELDAACACHLLRAVRVRVADGRFLAPPNITLTALDLSGNAHMFDCLHGDWAHWLYGDEAQSIAQQVDASRRDWDEVEVEAGGWAEGLRALGPAPGLVSLKLAGTGCVIDDVAIRKLFWSVGNVGSGGQGTLVEMFAPRLDELDLSGNFWFGDESVKALVDQLARSGRMVVEIRISDCRRLRRYVERAFLHAGDRQYFANVAARKATGQTLYLLGFQAERFHAERLEHPPLSRAMVAELARTYRGQTFTTLEMHVTDPLLAPALAFVRQRKVWLETDGGKAVSAGLALQDVAPSDSDANWAELATAHEFFTGIFRAFASSALAARLRGKEGAASEWGVGVYRAIRHLPPVRRVRAIVNVRRVNRATAGLPLWTSARVTYGLERAVQSEDAQAVVESLRRLLAHVASGAAIEAHHARRILAALEQVLRRNDPGAAEKVFELLNTNLFADRPDALGETPFFVACRAGHGTVARALHERGAAVDQACNGQYAVHAACAGGHIHIVLWLLEEGADLFAAGDGWLSLIRWDERNAATLLFAGREHARERSLATWYGQGDLAALCACFRATPLEGRGLLYPPDDWSLSAVRRLQSAIRKGPAKALEFVRSGPIGFSVNAFMKPAPLVMLDVVCMMIEHVTSKPVDLEQLPKLLQTLEHFAPAAVRHMDAAATRILLRAMERVLRCAAALGRRHVSALLKQGLLADRPAASGPAPLWVAAASGCRRMVALLCELGADPNRLHEGMSPLHLACKHDKPAMAASLLDAGADPQARSAASGPMGSLTPLEMAAFHGGFARFKRVFETRRR